MQIGAKRRRRPLGSRAVTEIYRSGRRIARENLEVEKPAGFF
jgi:hypothetical protein